MGMFKASKGGLSLADRLAIFSAALDGDYDSVRKIREAPARAAQQEAIRQAGIQAAGLLRPVPGAIRQAKIDNGSGEDITAAFAPQMEQGPSRRRTPDEFASGMADLASRTPGFNPTPYVDLAKYAKPDVAYDRGFGYDRGTGEPAGAFHPDLDKGQEPLYDRQGNVVAVRNLDGSVQAAAAKAGAIKGAEAAAQAPYEFIATPTPSGAPEVRAKSAAVGRVFTGQAPTEAMRAKDATQAGIDLPQNTQTAQQTLSLIDALRHHPGRKLGTGATGVLPGIPGTDQKDFVTLLDQAKGKAFLEAFATLKGGGQITEVEGAKATAAIARLDRTQSEAGFLRALDDLEAIVKAGQARAHQRAAGGAPAPASAPAAPRTTMGRSRIISVQ